MNWGRALGLAFGVMKTVDLTKEALNPYGVPPEWSKSALTVILSGAGAAVLGDGDWRERVLLAGAVAGTASVVHEAYAVLTTTSDRNKQLVIAQGARLAASANRRVSQV